MSLMLILSMDFQGHSITAPPKVSNVIYMWNIFQWYNFKKVYMVYQLNKLNLILYK